VIHFETLIGFRDGELVLHLARTWPELAAACDNMQMRYVSAEIASVLCLRSLLVILYRCKHVTWHKRPPLSPELVTVSCCKTIEYPWYTELSFPRTYSLLWLYSKSFLNFECLFNNIASIDHWLCCVEGFHSFRLRNLFYFHHFKTGLEVTQTLKNAYHRLLLLWNIGRSLQLTTHTFLMSRYKIHATLHYKTSSLVIVHDANFTVG
jgi:hypothetical protein